MYLFLGNFCGSYFCNDIHLIWIQDEYEKKRERKKENSHKKKIFSFLEIISLQHTHILFHSLFFSLILLQISFSSFSFFLHFVFECFDKRRWNERQLFIFFIIEKLEDENEILKIYKKHHKPYNHNYCCFVIFLILLLSLLSSSLFLFLFIPLDHCLTCSFILILQSN